MRWIKCKQSRFILNISLTYTGYTDPDIAGKSENQHMHTFADNTHGNKSKTDVGRSAQLRSIGAVFRFPVDSPEPIAQTELRKMADDNPRVQQLKALQGMADNSPQSKHAAQLQTMADTRSSGHPSFPENNHTGLPDNLKSGIENLSGFSMDDVKVHRNSNKPAQLHAHAYAQGTDIHLAAGQEKHLPHEAWHVVQQKQGRVKPTLQMKGGATVNDDKGLESEADEYGILSLVSATKKVSGSAFNSVARRPDTNNIIQRKLFLGKLEITAENWKSDFFYEVRRSVNSKYAGWHLAGEGFDSLRKSIDHGHLTFLNADAVADWLVEQGSLRAVNPKRKGNPNTRGALARLNKFSSTTEDMVKIQDGEHRRHVIGRHTLWQAVERAGEKEREAMANFVRFWDSKARGGNVLEQAYSILQNAPGNLWPGKGGENSAIGFFTGDIYNIIHSALKAAIKTNDGSAGSMADNNFVSLHFLEESLSKSKTFGFADKEYQQLVNQFRHQVWQEVGEGETSIDADILADIAYGIGSTCEFDPPPDEKQTLWIGLMDRMRESNAIFSDGTAMSFMLLAAGRQSVVYASEDKRQKNTTMSDDAQEPVSKKGAVMLYQPSFEQNGALEAANLELDWVEPDGLCVFGALAALRGRSTRDIIDTTLNFVMHSNNEFIRANQQAIIHTIKNNDWASAIGDKMMEIACWANDMGVTVLHPNGGLEEVNGGGYRVVLVNHPLQHYHATRPKTVAMAN